MENLNLKFGTAQNETILNVIDIIKKGNNWNTFKFVQFLFKVSGVFYESRS